MPLGGGGGNAKEDNPGEGEGGGSQPGSKGEAKDAEGPPSRHRVTPSQDVGDAEGRECLVESLVGLPEGFAGWGTIGGYILFFFFVVLSLFFSFGMMYCSVCVLYFLFVLFRVCFLSGCLRVPTIVSQL